MNGRMGSHWHWATLEVRPVDLIIQPNVGPETNLDREGAHREIQTLLDRLAAEQPALRQAAAIWRRGAKDDTVFNGPWTFSILACGQRSCDASIQAFLDDFAETMRQATGMHVGVAQVARRKQAGDS